MIPDDTDDDEPIDFSYIYFIGKTKLGLSFAETGRLTIKTWRQLYQHYKDDFDLEMMLRATNTTYAALRAKTQREDEWF